MNPVQGIAGLLDTASGYGEKRRLEDESAVKVPGNRQALERQLEGDQAVLKLASPEIEPQTGPKTFLQTAQTLLSDLGGLGQTVMQLGAAGTAASLGRANAAMQSGRVPLELIYSRVIAYFFGESRDKAEARDRRRYYDYMNRDVLDLRPVEAASADSSSEG